ncbi:hypothetical protein [Fulvivirga sediminis]|uniref:SDR family oxidoreductase n=1 Tax=Fulvivirga sediminis TaxID=2803949 RepID=A0A937JYQ5_9BACT|nr:hypothetical protein [Fulvivirga sediminis]MBL3654505.1 hypothetical protein [Fulvivirga sediminis]
MAEEQNLSSEQMQNAIIQPTEIANLAVYLSSPLSVATNGASLRADSGVLKTV